MKYLINADYRGENEDASFESVEEVISYLNDELPDCNQARDAFDEEIDEEGSIDICGIEFYRSDILKNCDETAYRTFLLDWVDSVTRDFENDIDRLYDGETIDIYGIEIMAVEDDDEDEGEE